jgi:hypothetical protein
MITDNEMFNAIMESILCHSVKLGLPGERYKNIAWTKITEEKDGTFGWIICDVHGKLTTSHEAGGMAVDRNSHVIKEDLADCLMSLETESIQENSLVIREV